MATVTLHYDDRNTLIKSILHSAILAGATEISTKEMSPTDTAEDVCDGRLTSIFATNQFPQKEEALDIYQKMFGKRKKNKYTDNEIFVYNAQRNLAKIMERYED
ncbi:MAG: hypothetical protein LBE56_13860 [Tannerella sp.]|jgi:hypothetical protein|nr:hypothetical protein [Tannerella sp.]